MPTESATPALLLDTAAPRISVGLCDASGEEWETREGESGTVLFELVERLLRRRVLAPADLASVILCDGPGSLLGVRVAAMAVRVWASLPRPRPLRIGAYHSLALLAADLLAGGVPAPFTVLADARRAGWHALEVEAEGTFAAPRRVDAARLATVHGPRYRPDSFPVWQAIPEGVVAVPYRPERLPDLARRFDLVRPVDAPDAFVAEPATYAPWSGEVHRAPNPS